MPISEDEITVISDRGNADLSMIDASKPAVPEPAIAKDRGLSLMCVTLSHWVTTGAQSVRDVSLHMHDVKIRNLF